MVVAPPGNGSVSGGGQNYDVTACPAAVNRSGDLCLVSDESNAIAEVCPPGQTFDPTTGECTPLDTLMSDAGITVIRSADTLSGGVALQAAKGLATLVPTLSQQLLAAMDTNHDGLLSTDEMLNPDLLGPTLRPLLVTFTDTLRRDMAPGIANEQLTGVPIATINGDLLSLPQPCRRRQLRRRRPGNSCF